MRALILGGGGMLARALEVEAEARGVDASAPTELELDITDGEAVRGRLDAERPDVVLNAAALTDVDGCETRRQAAFEVNGEAVGRLAALTDERQIVLVHVSTDFVFDGNAAVPYSEDGRVGPLSVYGESKLLGERKALEVSSSLVVRTSWLFGPGGRNFVATIFRLARTRDELRVVDDQVGCPTYTPFLARALFDAVDLGARGLLHYRNSEAVSWCGFARAIVRASGLPTRVVAVSTEELSRPARRPAYSVLDVGRFEALVGRRVESWHNGLESYLPWLEREDDALSTGPAPV